MKKIYFAGKWEERKIIRSLMNAIESAGHEITWDWTGEEEGADLMKHAVADIIGVQSADIYIVLAKRDLDYKGAYCEFGAALGLNKPVFVIGDAMNSCIFIHHPLVTTVDFLQEALDIIDEI